MAPRREQGGKVFILKDRPQDISACQIRMPFGKGCMGHTSGFCRHRLTTCGWSDMSDILLLSE